MDTPIESRLRRLERLNRVSILLVLAAALVAMTGSASQDEPAEPIRAERFELVDADGTVRAVLGTDADGSTGLFIHDAAGTVRLSVTHDDSQSALFISDAEGTVRIGVAQFAHGGGGVALHGEASKGATVLYHKGSGSLRFFDDEGETTARFPDEG